MYYHNSPTLIQLKSIKYAKASEMRIHIKAMKDTTRKYAKAMAFLDKVREQELFIDNEIATGRLSGEALASAEEVLRRNRKKAKRVTDNIIKKSIDIIK